jgi:hypothetical protein
MGMRKRLDGKLRCTPNLVICGVGSVLMSLLGCMEWGCGRILGRVWRSFQFIQDLMREMAPRPVSGMIFGVETRS